MLRWCFGWCSLDSVACGTRQEQLFRLLCVLPSRREHLHELHSIRIALHAGPMGGMMKEARLGPHDKVHAQQIPRIRSNITSQAFSEMNPWTYVSWVITIKSLHLPQKGTSSCPPPLPIVLLCVIYEESTHMSTSLQSQSGYLVGDMEPLRSQ